LEIDLKIYWLY